MEEKKNIPEIRFKEFEGEWEEKRLKDISDIIGGGTPSTFIPEYWDGKIDWYSPTEIGDKVYADGSVKKITSLGLTNSSAKILPKNKTILFTSRAGIGDMAILKKDGATNQGFQSFVLKNGIEPYFIYSAGHLIKTYALKHASGSTFLEVSSKTLGEMNLLIPTAKEQSQIGSFFKNLDKQITLEQQKYDKLVTLKKAMLEKMFPKEGEDIPEIRFKGFEEEWEEKKLYEICSYHTSTLSFNSVSPNGSYELYDASGVIGYTNDNIQDKEYITIIKDGSGVGRVRLLPENTSFIGTMGAFKAKESNIHFLLCCLLITDFNKHITGATIPHIYFSNYGTEEFHVPSIEEQTKIGSYFQNLDKLISLQQKKINKLKNIKKACLEKMFV